MRTISTLAPPSALICRAIERAAANDGLTHLGRLTVNLFRPAPVGECRVEVATEYVGRNAGHYSGRLMAQGKDITRFTALMQREDDLPIPDGTPGASVAERPEAAQPMSGRPYALRRRNARLRRPGGESDRGRTILQWPLRRLVSHDHPLVKGEAPTPYQRVAVAADSANGISAALDFGKYLFINCDLTLNLFRRPEGEWICLEARSLFGGNGCGLAESALYDERGMIGRATQSLTVRPR